MKIYVALVLCMAALAESRAEHQNRLHYGAAFRHLGLYENRSQSLQEVISMKLPFWKIPQFNTSRAEVTRLLNSLTQAFLRREHVTETHFFPPAGRLTASQRARILTHHRPANFSLAANPTANPLGVWRDVPGGPGARLTHVVWESETELVGEWRGLWLERLVGALRALQQGRLTPVLVPPDFMQGVVDDAQTRAAASGLRLAHTDLDFYYRHAAAEAFFDGDAGTLEIAFPLPLTNDAPFQLYRVETPAVAVSQASNNATRLVGVPQFLAVRGDGAVELSSQDLAGCEAAGGVWRCDGGSPLVTSPRQSCLLAVFREDALAVRAACSYVVARDGLEPGVREVLPGLALVSRVEDLVLQCWDGSVRHAGCRQCLVRLPCRCSLMAEGFETAQRLRECRDDLPREEAVVPAPLSSLGYLAKALPPDHPLLAELQRLGARLNVSDVPEPLLGTLPQLAADMGHPRLGAGLAVVTQLQPDLANSFAQQWDRALNHNTLLYHLELLIMVAIVLVLVLVFAVSCCIFSYQRRHLEVRLIAAEMEHVDCTSAPPSVQSMVASV